MNKIFTLGAVAALSFSMNAQAASFIDLFQTPNFVRDTTANGVAVTQDGVGADIIGGIRNVSANLINDLSASTNNGTQIDISSGVLAFDNDTNSGGEGRVQWNGMAGMQDLSLAGGFGLGLDAYSLGSGFTYETLFLDLTSFDFTVEAYTDENTFTKVTVRTTSVGVEQILFKDLENALLCGSSFGPIISVECGTNGTVDMSNLGALQTVLNVNGGRISVDLAIGPITLVPEPSMIGLLAAGLFAIGFVSSRRSNGFQA